MLAITLTACSSDTAIKELGNEGVCSADQKLVVSDHISSQISALEKNDFEKAYTYAAESFQLSISQLDFKRIIQRQYQFLITNTGFTFGSCEVDPMGLTQKVSVKSGISSYQLSYDLTLINGKLGIVAANIIEASEGVNT